MNTALLLSGGIGTRMGVEVPKQYLKVNDKMIFSFCLKTLLEHEKIDAVQIVAHSVWHEIILKEVKRLCIASDCKKKLKGFSKPGENRQLSIFHGLQDIIKYATNDAVVCIHDAARPLLSDEQITQCFEALKEHDGVMPVLPMKDTVYQSKDGKVISELLDRSCIFAGQAPEVFRLEKYYQANEKLLPDKILQINGSTEPAILFGMDIVMVPGEERNFKITTIEDFRRFQEILLNSF